MHALKRILVGTDFSRAASLAVARAALLAAEHGASLTIMHARPRLPGAGLRALGLRRAAGTRLDLQAEAAMREALEVARGHGVTPAARIVVGEPAATLARDGARLGADLLVVGHRGGRSLREAVTGTTAERLLERSDGDVLVVRAPPAGPYERILACVALGPVSRAVVLSARALSREAPLTVLHAYQSPYEALLLDHGAGHDVIEEHRHAFRAEAERKLDALLRKCRLPEHGRGVTRILRRGRPPEVIRSAAIRLRADVLVIGRNQSRLEALFLGSITKHVTRTGLVDVLVADPRRGGGG